MGNPAADSTPPAPPQTGNPAAPEHPTRTPTSPRTTTPAPFRTQQPCCGRSGGALQGVYRSGQRHADSAAASQASLTTSSRPAGRQGQRLQQTSPPALLPILAHMASSGGKSATRLSWCHAGRNSLLLSWPPTAEGAQRGEAGGGASDCGPGCLPAGAACKCSHYTPQENSREQGVQAWRVCPAVTNNWCVQHQALSQQPTKPRQPTTHGQLSQTP